VQEKCQSALDVKLLKQPDDGLAPLLKGIDRAKTCIEILIFRFDQLQLEKALLNAVSRGVSVRALIAHVNGSGGESLRRLEMRLLAAGVTVARTDDTLARYHAKLMIVDRRELYVLAFNWTHQDIEHSRSFGLIIKNRNLVQEAVKLFGADSKRQPYKPGLPTLVVSPENSRKQLTSFIKAAKHELLIYDPKISDPAMIRLLQERSRANVSIRILGALGGKNPQVSARQLSHMRLHSRCMIRDRKWAFVGSQSLRTLELDGRREVGVICRDPSVVNDLAKTFDKDWKRSASSQQEVQKPGGATKVAKKIAKAVAKDLSPVAPILNGVMKEITKGSTAPELDVGEVEQNVRETVREAVSTAIEQAIEPVIEPRTVSRE
jgi:cardiolipin synthase A/B